MIENFALDFFDHNPISQLGIIATKNGKAEKVMELGCNASQILSVLKSQAAIPCKGEPSLQNACEMALRTLKNTPMHVSKEILVILGSITTCDPGDIHDTIKKLQEGMVRCSVIGLAAEVRICKVLAQKTEGKYDVIMNEAHFKEVFAEHVRPPVAKTSTESSLIRMGFPVHSMQGVPSFCACHLNTASSKLTKIGYFCPQVSSMVFVCIGCMYLISYIDIYHTFSRYFLNWHSVMYFFYT
jgi:transcription initiation factor TFIIH subunit 2